MAKVGPTHISASDSSAVRRANEGGWDRSGNGRPSLEVASRVSLDFGKKIAKS